MREQWPTAQDLCDWLSQTGVLKLADLGRAQKIAAAQGGTDQAWLHTLLRLGALREQDMISAYANLLDVTPMVDVPAPAVMAEVPGCGERFARHHRLAPLADEPHALKVAAGVPLSYDGLRALRYQAGKPLAITLANGEQLERLFDRLYASDDGAAGALIDTLGAPDAADDIEHLKDLASEAPVIRLVNGILHKAVECRASDIHVEPFENELKVRYRVDGQLITGEAPAAGLTAAVVSRLKIMARLDIAERRLPQDGRIMLRVHGRELDLRVSTVPTSFGESVVMRLLDRQNLRLDFAQMGIESAMQARIESLLARPHGIVLVTGPTGSGKTTTLYTALSGLNTHERKIITVEDPVEYQLPGINQIQVKPAIGLGFAEALRSIVRQDPDVIMIGEMRDLETCRIAIQSSLTGHLVLSTLHTNSAAASLTRLLDMGVEGYLIASTLQGVLAQRLVRMLDPATRIRFEAPQALIDRHGLGRFTQQRPIYLYRPDEQAEGAGYQGRCAILELLVMNDSLRELLMRQADAGTLESAACEHGLVTLYEDGLRLAVAGVTSLEEVLRVTGSD